MNLYTPQTPAKVMLEQMLARHFVGMTYTSFGINPKILNDRIFNRKVRKREDFSHSDRMGREIFSPISRWNKQPLYLVAVNYDTRNFAKTQVLK